MLVYSAVRKNSGICVLKGQCRVHGLGSVGQLMFWFWNGGFKLGFVDWGLHRV